MMARARAVTAAHVEIANLGCDPNVRSGVDLNERRHKAVKLGQSQI